MRKVTLPLRESAELVEAYYGDEAVRHLRGVIERSASASGPAYAALENEVHVLHELHAAFSPDADGELGIRMLSEAEAAERGLVDEPLTGHGGFRIPAKAQPQTALFTGEMQSDAVASEVARDEAMRRVDMAADPQAKVLVMDAIRTIAREQETFVSDDVWLRLGWQPEEPRMIGPLMLAAAKLGYIEKADGQFQNARRVVNHARPQQVWRSRIRGQEALA